MRPLVDMDTIQIEVTNACHINCSNCTRFCGHHRKPYMMEMDYFKRCVDSLAEFPQMVGMMGGEPLLHPQFEAMCDYASSLIPPERMGLWTTFPEGKEHHREVICRTFGNIFLNDQTLENIYHWPVLVGAEEVCPDKDYMWYLIDHCWLQNAWSAAVNPNGAFFCEIAAAMSILFNMKDTAWPVEKGWWKRTPKDYVKQMETFCPKCGCAMPLKKRASIDEIDDISPKNFERLKDFSPKIKAGKYKVYIDGLVQDNSQMAAYKDQHYRENVADRYGIFLSLNEKGFNTPYLKRKYERSAA